MKILTLCYEYPPVGGGGGNMARNIACGLARRGNLVAFVEVKWRNRVDDLDTAIDAWRLRRVAAAAEVVAHKYAQNGEDLRIDVILLAPRAFPRHITNAWQP